MRIVTTDIGGTHARFALATVEGGRVVSMDEPVVLKTNEHASFQTAWEEFGRRCGEDLPKSLAIAFAGPIGGELLKLTNNPWVIRPALIPAKLGVDRHVIVNDFGAVAHAVAALDDKHLQHICGPGRGLPERGAISIVGPGTGLGVAILLRRGGGDYDVIETEGGHVDFAPLDAIEDAILTASKKYSPKTTCSCGSSPSPTRSVSCSDTLRPSFSTSSSSFSTTRRRPIGRPTGCPRRPGAPTVGGSGWQAGSRTRRRP